MIVLIFSLNSCSNTKTVYWCGDHACVNKKEKETYFKKNMIIEKRVINRKKKKDKSTLDVIIDNQSLNNDSNNKNLTAYSKNADDSLKLNKKKLSKEARLKEKKRIKEEKELAKQIRLEEKMRIKQEKELAKKIRLEKKRRIKEEKKISKIIEKKEISKNSNKINKVEIKTFSTSSEIDPTIFDKMVEKIIKRNMLKPYPSINDIPN